MLSIRSARDLAMSGVTWDTITRAVAKVVSSSSIMVRPCRAFCGSRQILCNIIADGYPPSGKKRKNRSAEIEEKIRFRLSTIMVAKRVKKEGFSVCLSTVFLHRILGKPLSAPVHAALLEISGPTQFRSHAGKNGLTGIVPHRGAEGMKQRKASAAVLTACDGIFKPQQC